MYSWNWRVKVHPPRLRAFVRPNTFLLPTFPLTRIAFLAFEKRLSGSYLVQGLVSEGMVR